MQERSLKEESTQTIKSVKETKQPFEIAATPVMMKTPEISKEALPQSFFVTNLDNSTFLNDEPYESQFLATNTI